MHHLINLSTYCVVLADPALDFDKKCGKSVIGALGVVGGIP